MASLSSRNDGSSNDSVSSGNAGNAGSSGSSTGSTALTRSGAGSGGNAGGGAVNGTGGSSGNGSGDSAGGADSAGITTRLFLDGVPPRRGALLITAVAEIMSEGLTAAQMNVLGSFLTSVGDLLSYMAAQHEFNEAFFGTQVTTTGQPETGETEEDEILPRPAIAAVTAGQSGQAGNGQADKAEQADESGGMAEGLDQLKQPGKAGECK